MNRHQRKHIVAFLRLCIKQHILCELERNGYVAPSISDTYYLVGLPHDKIKAFNGAYSFREYWRWSVRYIVEPAIKGYDTPKDIIKYLTPQLKEVTTSHLLLW